MRDLARGETLFAAGEDNSVCATLISDMLKVSALDEEGRERILACWRAMRSAMTFLLRSAGVLRAEAAARFDLGQISEFGPRHRARSA